MKQPKPFKLTRKRLIQKAVEAFREGTIAFQQADYEKRGSSRNCEYISKDGCHCIVGAALPAATLTYLRDQGGNGFGVGTLTLGSDPVLVIDGDDELQFLRDIQDLHDRSLTKDDPKERRQCRDELTARIQHWAEAL